MNRQPRMAVVVAVRAPNALRRREGRGGNAGLGIGGGMGVALTVER